MNQVKLVKDNLNIANKIHQQSYLRGTSHNNNKAITKIMQYFFKEIILQVEDQRLATKID